MPDSLILRFGLSVLKTIAKNHIVEEFALLGQGRRDSVIRDMLDRLTPDQRVSFTTGKYTDETHLTFPCIHLSASGEYTDSIVVVYSSLVYHQ